MRWPELRKFLAVRKSKIAGKGLFTNVSLEARRKIGEFEGERISLRESRRRAKLLKIISIVELSGHAIDSSQSKSGFRYVNHSCNPNTFIRCTDTRAEFYTLRKIKKGEELTADYVESHHNGKLPCRCGAENCRGAI